MAVFQSLNIPEDAKHAFANGIFNAVTNDMPELIQEQELPTTVGGGLFRWNFINRNVSRNLDGTFQATYAKRGAWRALLLYESSVKFTFSIMTENNLGKLQHHLPTNLHYLEALVSQNIGYQPIEGQMRLEECDRERDPSMVAQLRDQLLCDFAGIVENHIVILFDYDYSRVLSARAVLLTPKLEVAFSEDWSKYLNKPYFHKDTILAVLTENDDEESLVSIKPNVEESKDEPDVALVEQEDISNE